jgi:ribonuclease HII
MTRVVPTRDVEDELIGTGARTVAGMDEVGRGALAGPVMVGVVVVDARTGPVPDGLADSKLLTPRRREAMVPVIEQWCAEWALGEASAEEIDRLGIMAALGLAGSRALGALAATPEVVVLDGTTSFLLEEHEGPRVVLRAKADRDVACVAAASVLAKVARDALMVRLDGIHPSYGWAGNKGYGSAGHTDAIARCGTTNLHRRSWNLGGV